MQSDGNSIEDSTWEYWQTRIFTLKKKTARPRCHNIIVLVHSTYAGEMLRLFLGEVFHVFNLLVAWWGNMLVLANGSSQQGRERHESTRCLI